jgi:hypothetical protein
LPYFALCYLKDESKETAGKMEEICKILREYMTAIEQKIEYGEKERHEVIYSFMDYFFMEGKIEEKIKRAKIILDTFKINYSNLYPLDKVIDKYSDFIKYEIVSFFLLKEEDGFIWNPSKNDDFLRFVEKHEKPWLFKYPSSIKPLYYALLGKTKLDDYPSLVTAYNIECEVSNNIITIDNGIKWEWEKGKQTRILYSFLNPSVFRDGFIELCHKCYNDDQDSPDNELIQLFDIDVSRKPLLIPGDDGNYKFIVHYQLSHAPVVEKTSSVDEENITLLETYLDHIHSLYETELHRRRGRQHALSSAVAAIMARNMSHLLGSHVEPGVQNDIPSFIEECMQSKAFKDLAKKLNEGDFNCIKSRLRNRGISKTLLETSNDSSERKEAILNLIDAKDKALERYSVYHQRRMDFIARIATEWPRWGVGYEFYRHFIFPFMSNSILLHFVGYSDGFTIENIDFSVKVNDKPIKEKYNWRMDCKRAKNNVSL